AKSITKQSDQRVDLNPFVIAFNIEGAPTSFDGHHSNLMIRIEWFDGTKTPLSLDLGHALDFNGLTSLGDTLSYMAYSDGHEGQYRLEDIELLNISDDGKCCLHLNDGTHFTIAHLAITGSH